MRLPCLRLLASLVGLLPCSLWSQEFETTQPRGFYVVKVAGTQPGESQARTFLGVQLMPEARYAGQVASVSGDAFSFQNLSSHQQIENPSRPSYVHVIDGDGRGFITDIVEYRQNDLKCAADLAPWMAPFTQVTIRPHPNLSDIFGANNRFSFASGTAAELADNVVAWDADTQLEKVYYYHSGRQRWEEKDINADAGTALLKFPYGIYIIRRSAGNLRMTLSGDVSGAPILLPVRTGANVFSLPVNLSSSLANLIPVAGNFPVIAGTHAAQGDLVTLEEPSSGLQRGPFYLSSRPGATGWREVGASDSEDTIQPLDFLSTLVIRRNGPAGYVRVEGNLAAGSGFPLPVDPEGGVVLLEGAFPIAPFRPQVTYAIEVSTDLQNWSFLTNSVSVENGVLSFSHPVQESRGFYRLRISMN